MKKHYLNPSRFARFGCLIALILWGISFSSQAAVEENKLPGRPVPVFKQLNVDDGLAQSWISDIVQDPRGFVWLATQNGLSRYDGQQFITYRHQTNTAASIQGNSVNDLLIDHQGLVWIVAGSGLDLYQPQTNNFKHILSIDTNMPSLGVKIIYRTLEDQQNRLWITADTAILMKEPNKDEFIKFSAKSPELPVKEPARMFLLSDGTILLSSIEEGLWVYKEQSKKFVLFFDGQDLGLNKFARTYRKIIEAPDKTLWVGTRNGLLHVSRSGKLLTWSNREKGTLPASLNIRDMILDNKGRMWVTTKEKGIFRLTLDGALLDNIEHIADAPYTLPTNATSKLMVDNQNQIWVGTEGKGVAIWNPDSEWTRRVDYDASDPNGLADPVVWNIFQDAKNQLWIGNDKGIDLWDSTNNRFIHYQLGKQEWSQEPASSLDIEQSFDGFIWSATNIGLVKLDPNTGLPTSFRSKTNSDKGLASEFIYALKLDKKQRLWIGHDNGLSYLDTKTMLFHHFEYKIRTKKSCKGAASYIYEDIEGGIWIGTATGICKYQEETQDFKNFLYEERGSTPDDIFFVTSLLVHKKTLWVGYSGNGLVRLDLSDENAKSTHYTLDNGLPSNNISSILVDDKDRLWLTTQTGLVIFDPNDLNLRIITGLDGLGDSEFNEGAYLRLRNGDFAFGTVKGFVLINAARLESNSTPQKVVITELTRLDNRTPISHDQEFSLPEESSALKVDFSLMNFYHPEQDLYQYRVVGQDDKWVDLLSRSQLLFSNFDNGDYRIDIRGRNFGSEWGDVTSIKFNVYPPAWRSWLALTLYAFFAFSLLSAFLAYRFQKNREKLQMLEVIRGNEQQLRLSLDASGQGVWDWTAEGDEIHHTKFNELVLVQSDAEPKQLVNYWGMIYVKDRLKVIHAWQDHLFGLSGTYICQYRIFKNNGQHIWIEEQGKAITRDDLGMANHITGTYKNITELKAIENDLELFAKAFSDTNEGVIVVNDKFEVIKINQAAEKLTGYGHSSLIGKSLAMLRSSRQPWDFYQDISLEISKKGSWQGEVWQRTAYGKDIPMWVNVSAIHYRDGQPSNYVYIFNDISDRKEAEEELTYLANYDSLTNLPNRTLLRDRLEHAILSSNVTHHPFAILFLDLDRFKKVNDSFGHTVGDKLLCEIAVRIKSCLQPDDTISRLGGDEFVVLMEHFTNIGAIATMTENIKKAMKLPFRLEGFDISTSFSMGVSIYPGDGKDAGELLKNADISMYHAKKMGRNRLQFYTPEMNEKALERLTLENQLRSAINSSELEVWYQPQIDGADGSLYGAEALVRWNHPEKGLVSPVDFIPIAEESDLICELGKEVFSKVCQQLKIWQNQGIYFQISVNLAARQLMQLDLVETISHIVNEENVDPKYLCLEITETALMEDLPHAKEVLTKLRHKGFKVAIDDFGTGYSSMNYLRNIPLDVLKIDYAFVSEMLLSNIDQAIIRAIIELGNALNVTVLAEGVETKSQRDMLQKKGCHLFQGYLYDRPMPINQFEFCLKKYHPKSKREI